MAGQQGIGRWRSAGRGFGPLLRAACGLYLGLSLVPVSAPALAQTPQANTPPFAAQREVPPAAAAPAARQAAAQPAAAGAVKMRAGEHPAYTRLVFDFPQRVDYTATTEGAGASLRFQSPSPLDLGVYARRPPKGVAGLSAAVEGAESVVRFSMPEGATLKHWRDGGKVVADVTFSASATAAPAAAAAPAPAAPAPAAQAPAPSAAARPGPAANGRAAPQAVPQPAAPPAAAAASPAARPAAPMPQPQPPAMAQAPAAATAMAQRPPTQNGTPQAGVPAAAPVLPVQADSLDRIMPVPQNVPLSGEPMVPLVDASRTGPLLIFPWTRAVGAAAYMRNGYLWLVFDRPAVVDLRPISTRDWNGQINDVSQLSVPGMTVLRLAVPSGTSTVFSRRNTGWSIAINTGQNDPAQAPAAASGEGAAAEAPAQAAPAPPAPGVASGRLPPIDLRRQLDSESGAKMFFAANDPSPALMLPDPDVGDTVVVIPYAGPNGGVPERREFVEFVVLPSFQGLAFEPKAGNLEFKRFPRGVEVSQQNGLSISAPRGAGTQQGSAEIFDYENWRKAPGENALEKKQNLQRAIGLASPGQRASARLALAQFYFATDLHAESLGVLARARNDTPELERDKRFRAMRGVSNLKMGRVNEAATDLDSRVFDDDPDVLAYRGLLSAMRDDWPSARKSFSQAGGAVSRFPPDVRAPLRLAMARAWLSGGDIVGADAEIKALASDELNRGQAAEAHYVRGLLAQAQGKPEEALRSFDLAISSGDRKARALAEYAKIEFMLARKMATPQEAIERLDGLRFAWRGDPYEFNLLRRLGELQFASGDLRSGIGTFRQIVKNFPKSADIPLLTKQMSDEFARLFLDGGAQAMPPLQALALYYDYRELTPAGPDGDEIIGKLADRLVGVDLLNRAGELLEHQIQYRLRGEERAKAGARLAVVNLLDRKPEAALKALQGTDAANLTAGLVAERRMLQARALADLDRFAEALTLLGNDNSPEARGLRADIHWRAKDWVAAARVLNQNLGSRYADSAPLTPEERKQVLQWGVALSLTNDTVGLEDLRKKYQDKFRGTPDAESFAAIASTITRGSGDARELATAIAQIGQYEAFMSKYRERVARGGITAIN